MKEACSPDLSRATADVWSRPPNGSRNVVIEPRSRQCVLNSLKLGVRNPLAELMIRKRLALTKRSDSSILSKDEAMDCGLPNSSKSSS